MHDGWVHPFYRRDGPSRYASSASTAGPWGPGSQHGGPPAALLARAVEALDADRDRPEQLHRQPADDPVGPLRVEASVVRPGRTVQMCEATAYDDESGRACARATAWLFPASDEGPVQHSEPPAHGPADGVHKEPPASWSGGYLDAVDWRWVLGAVTGPALTYRGDPFGVSYFVATWPFRG